MMHTISSARGVLENLNIASLCASGLILDWQPEAQMHSVVIRLVSGAAEDVHDMHVGTVLRYTWTGVSRAALSYQNV